MIDLVLNYFQGNGAITVGVLAFLSLYLILTIWIFVYKLLELNSSISQEKDALESLIHEDCVINPLSSGGQFVGS